MCLTVHELLIPPCHTFAIHVLLVPNCVVLGDPHSVVAIDTGGAQPFLALFAEPSAFMTLFTAGARKTAFFWEVFPSFGHIR
ncbi:hypothetical protein JTE90_029108 [Oedothorax gibbosus]|uniref:Secreted protein n=1 Tax=Oedothorax gibbosus TaxID=931172 RepID=A0AAV6V8G7_9ARAC|nr:hypothetical protein JTE90_029108 [Oedothorax gibbosus]